MDIKIESIIKTNHKEVEKRILEKSQRNSLIILDFQNLTEIDFIGFLTLLKLKRMASQRKFNFVIAGKENQVLQKFLNEIKLDHVFNY